MEHKELLVGLVPVTNKGQELIPHKDYEIKQDGEKFYLVKKKKEYPKTYAECSDILSVYTDPDINGYKGELLWTFQKLLICRDAYWKIYSEENGLEKPWEPNWTSFEGYPAIYMYRYLITLSVARDVHHCLVFPTAEMRDEFYENFKKEIEICKEFL